MLFLRKYGLNGILADDLGLGKTLQAICLLVQHHAERSAGAEECGPSLVVCPATLCSHWLFEVLKFTPEVSAGKGGAWRRRKIVLYQGNADARAQ